MMQKKINILHMCNMFKVIFLGIFLKFTLDNIFRSSFFVDKTSAI